MSESEIHKETHIDAAPRAVYDVVTDYESYPRIFPEFSETMVLDTEGNAKIVEFTADYGKVVSYTLRIEHDEEKLQTSWTYVGGDLKDSQGGWTFIDDGKGGTDIKYRLMIRVGMFIPRAISDPLISRNIPVMFGQLAEEVKRRASA